MNILKTILLAAAAVLVSVSCCGNAQKKAANSDAQTVALPDMHNAENALDWQGTYKGTLPAADGPGIEVTLTLKPDGRYEQHLKYIDRDAEFDAKGTCTVEGNLLTLSPADGEQPEYYKVEENRLRRLDTDKQPVTGALADHYILQKTTKRNG